MVVIACAELILDYHALTFGILGKDVKAERPCSLFTFRGYEIYANRFAYDINVVD